MPKPIVKVCACIAAACVAKVAGFGPDSYRTALEALLRRLAG